MGDRPARGPLLLTPSDSVLLRATRLAPAPRWSAEPDVAAPFLLALLFASGAAVAVCTEYRLAAAWSAAAGVLAGAIVVAAYLWRRFVRPRPTLVGRVDVPRLERLLLAEALLANEQAGLLALTEAAAAGLHAEPAAMAPVPWPAAALEAALLRGRPMRVAQLVADWRGGAQDPLEAIARRAVRRGVLRESGERHGAALAATSAAEAALAGGQPASLVEACRTDRPALWRRLMAAIDEGLLLAPAAAPVPPPAPDARADAGVDRYGVPSGHAPGQAVTTAILLGTTVVLAAIVVARLAGYGPDPPPVAGRWDWPLCFGVGSAAWLFVAARSPWPDETLPPHGSPGEEEVLAHRRYRRLARPRTRPPLPVRLLACAVLGFLVWVLTALVTPVGIAVLASGLGLVSWRGRGWYRMQLLMPSAREVELAVARRSRELSAGPEGTAMGDPAVAAGAAAGRRVRLRLTPADLPPPTPAALARTDRRRRLAAAAVRRHAVALLLFVAGLAAVAGVLVRYGRVDPLPVLLACAAWLLCLVRVARVPARLLRAIHLTRPQAWQVAPGMTACLLRRLAAVLPQAGAGPLPEAARALRRRLAEEPDFWRDETLDLAAPLGASPRAILAVATVLFLLPLTGGLLGSAPELGAAGAAGLGLVVAYARFLRRQRHSAKRMPPEPGPRLVLLRVFGSPSFDDLLELVRPWLLCGPIAHLEGYDSIARSVEVREAVASGRLDEVLVKSPEDLAGHLAALPDLPDDNGRYRREAFQCVDAVWPGAIRALLDRSDAVLMDLSGLGPTNMGCAYELGLLLDRVPLSRVLLLVDEATDLACLDLVLDRSERRIAVGSPNRDSAAAWRLLQIGGPSARRAGESHDAWLRRLDRRLAPLPLVHFMFDGTAAVATAPDHAGSASAKQRRSGVHPRFWFGRAGWHVGRPGST